MSDEPADVVIHPVETVALDDLKPHPRNYQKHPDDQIAHLVARFRDHGVYRPVVVANDGTILAGHGIWEAARRAGLTEVPVVRTDLDPDDPRALRLLVGDNEIPNLADVDDRGLTNLLREVSQLGEGGLLGTGLDEAMLANLVLVTRDAAEIATFDEAAAWVGLPEFEAKDDAGILLVLHFDDPDARTKLIDEIGLTVSKKTRETWSAWYPPRERQDLASLRFDSADD